MADAITTTSTSDTTASALHTSNRSANASSTTTATTLSAPVAKRSVTTTTIAGCTKIAIMQLFHEMKQEFATVPDYLVGQHVNANCNNRPALLKALKQESNRFPGSVQAYPQALRNQSQIVDHTDFYDKPTDLSNYANEALSEHSATKTAAANASAAAATKPPHHPASPSSSTLGRRPRVKIGHNRPLNQSKPMLSTPAAPPNDTSDTMATASTTNNVPNLSSRLNSEYSDTTQRDISTNHQPPHPTIPPKSTTNTVTKNSVQPKPRVPQRPSTLNLAPSPFVGPPTAFQLHRPAPAVPPRPTRLLYNKTNPSDPIDAPLNVSVNVTVSPMAGSPSSCTTSVRHTSAITVQPELTGPFFGAAPPRQPMCASPNRSFTTLQFKLRAPPDGSNQASSVHHPTSQDAPSPIDISAGPTQLTYSSASFDARKGLQSHFQITVDGGGNGSISATRTRPRYTMTNSGGEDTTTPSSSTAAFPGSYAAARSRHISPGHAVNDDLVIRQIQCKKRLLLELDNERTRLTLMQQEISTFNAPIPPGVAQQLAEDIRRLQNSCKQHVQLVQEAGPYKLGETDEAFYQQIQSSQSLLRSPQSARSAPQSLGSSAASLPNAFSLSASSATTPSSVASSPSYFVQPQAPKQSSHRQPPPLSPPDAQPWSCSMCTFQNHPLLNKCEQCEMPLMTTSGTNTTQTAPHTSLASSHSALTMMASQPTAPVSLPTRPAPPPPRPLHPTPSSSAQRLTQPSSASHESRSHNL